MLRAVFWDNDGVLVDTEGAFFEAGKQALQEVNITLTKEIYIDFNLKKGKSIFDLLRDQNLGEETINQTRAKRNHLFQTYLHNDIPLMPGVEDTLKTLAPLLTMGVVTSSWRENFEIVHKKTSLFDYISFSITDDECEKLKPYPEPYLKALEISGVSPEEALVVEDSERGLKAAVAAGLRCIVVPHELSKGSNFEQAYKVCSSIENVKKEILALL